MTAAQQIANMIRLFYPIRIDKMDCVWNKLRARLHTTVSNNAAFVSIVVSETTTTAIPIPVVRNQDDLSFLVENYRKPRFMFDR